MRDTIGIDIENVRADTLGCTKRIHLNNAGASLPPKQVTNTIVEYFRREEMEGGYEAQMAVQDALAGTYASLARLIGGAAQDIALTDGATRGWQSAIYALAQDWQRGDNIVTCEAEYPSNVYAYTYLRDRFGIETVYVADDEYGQVDLIALHAAIDSRTRLITATHIPTYGGLINPVAAIGEIAKASNIPFLLDACQSVGHLHIDVKEIGCDILTAAGRKYLRGPRGTGFLWVREGLAATLRPLFVDGASASWTTPDSFQLAPSTRRFELYERSPALHLGLGVAADYACSLGTRQIEERIIALAADLRGMLVNLPQVTVHDRGAALSGIVTFSVLGLDSEQVSSSLMAQGINTSVTAAGSAMRSFPKRGIKSAVRASVHYYNTHTELGGLCDAIKGMSAVNM